MSIMRASSTPCEACPGGVTAKHRLGDEFILVHREPGQRATGSIDPAPPCVGVRHKVHVVPAGGRGAARALHMH